MKKILLLVFLFSFFIKNGNAQHLNMNQLANWDPSPSYAYNDVWGYVDGSGNEYAIVGTYSTINFLRINANNTLTSVNQFSPGQTSTWRDFKTYQNKCYAVSEGSEGLLIYDLSNLPTSVILHDQITTDFNTAHNIFIDEAQGKLYVAGTNTRNNGLIVYDITVDPPNLIADEFLPGGGYVHDLYVRNDTAYCSHGNDGFYIWDFSNPTNPTVLGTYTTESGYNHSSWVDPTATYAFYAREVPTALPMTALDISNMSSISKESNFKFPGLAPAHTNNVPHNPYLVGDLLFTSYYEDGVQVFDVSDPSNVTLYAKYDTYPSNTNYNGYEGCWGVYPFLPSGKILASDGTNGLFLLEVVPPAACDVPTPTRVAYPYSNNSLVSVFWTEIPEASKYAIRYRVVGTSAWTIKRSSTPASQLNNIDPNAIYEYRLAARCPSGWTSYSGFYYFSRNLDVCISPIPNNVNNITSSSAKLWWHRLNNASLYRVIYRPVGTSSWTVSSTTSTNMSVTGLDPSTTYEFKLKGFCLGAWTDYSKAYHFTTASDSNISMSVYPNPTRGMVNISLENVSENAILQVFNVVGERVKVQLNWTTHSEIDNAFFEIEKSINGEDFFSIKKINGAGTYIETNHYQAWDEQPNDGSNYYRIKQVDADGTSSYSKTEFLFWENRTLKIYPTLITNDVPIQVELENEQDANIQIIDMNGKTVFNKYFERAFDFSIPASFLKNGVYFLQIKNATTEKVFKITVLK